MLILILIWFGLPILVEVFTHHSTGTMLRISKLPGFWEYISGDLGYSLRPKLVNNPESVNLIELDEVQSYEDWHRDNVSDPKPKLDEVKRRRRCSAPYCTAYGNGLYCDDHKR